MYDSHDDQEQPRDAQSDPSSHPSFPSAIQTTTRTMMKEVSGNKSMDRGSSSASLSVVQAQYWLGKTSASAIETIVMYE